MNLPKIHSIDSESSVKLVWKNFYQMHFARKVLNFLIENWKFSQMIKDHKEFMSKLVLKKITRQIRQKFRHAGEKGGAGLSLSGDIYCCHNSF